MQKRKQIKDKKDLTPNQNHGIIKYMKPIVYCFIILILFFTTTSYATDYKNFDEVVYILDTPYNICSWESSNFKYIPDKDIEFYTPKEIFERNGGDCDDWATFASYCLEQHGYESEIVFILFKISDREYCHAFCIYLERGLYNLIDTGSYREIKAANLLQVADIYCKDWIWIGTVQIIDHYKHRFKEFYNSKNRKEN